MTMRTILEIYFGLNLLLTGFDMSDGRKDDDTIWVVLLVLLLNMLFSFPLFVVASAIEYSEPFINYIQIRFIFSFFFTKYYRDITFEHVENIVHIITQLRKTNSIRDRWFRFCADMLFNRFLKEFSNDYI